MTNLSQINVMLEVTEHELRENVRTILRLSAQKIDIDIRIAELESRNKELQVFKNKIELQIKASQRPLTGKFYNWKGELDESK